VLAMLSHLVLLSLSSPLVQERIFEEWPAHGLSYSIEPLATEPTSYGLLSLRHLTNVRKKSKFQGASTSTRICVAPTCKYASSWEILTLLGRETERSISFGFRPTLLHHLSRTCILWATVGGSPKVCEIVAYCATRRNVTLSPPPPSKIGMGLRIGLGAHTSQWYVILSSPFSSESKRLPAVPNSYPYS
jgi:hypothetical protein